MALEALHSDWASRTQSAEDAVHAPVAHGAVDLMHRTRRQTIVPGSQQRVCLTAARVLRADASAVLAWQQKTTRNRARGSASDQDA